MSDDMPEQPKTVKDQAAVPVWAIELTRSVKSGIAEVRADVALVSNDLGLLKTRVSIMEGLRTEDDLRASKYSGGIKNLSQSDEGQNMQIASLAVKVDELAGKTDAQTLILGQLLKLTEKPVVKLIATAVGTAILTWLTAKGLR